MGAGVWCWRRQKPRGGRSAHLEPTATRRALNSHLLHELCPTSPDHGGISEPQTLKTVEKCWRKTVMKSPNDSKPPYPSCHKI